MRLRRAAGTAQRAGAEHEGANQCSFHFFDLLMVNRACHFLWTP
jgi:hypothetical protein